MVNSRDSAVQLLLMIQAIVGTAIIGAGAMTAQQIVDWANTPGPTERDVLANKDKPWQVLLGQFPMMQAAVWNAVTAAAAGIPNFAGATAMTLVYGGGQLLANTLGAGHPHYGSLILALQALIGKIVLFSEYEFQGERVARIMKDSRETETRSLDHLVTLQHGIVTSGATPDQIRSRTGALRSARASVGPMPEPVASTLLVASGNRLIRLDLS